MCSEWQWIISRRPAERLDCFLFTRSKGKMWNWIGRTNFAVFAGIWKKILMEKLGKFGAENAVFSLGSWWGCGLKGFDWMLLEVEGNYGGKILESCRMVFVSVRYFNEVGWSLNLVTFKLNGVTSYLNKVGSYLKHARFYLNHARPYLNGVKYYLIILESFGTLLECNSTLLGSG